MIEKLRRNFESGIEKLRWFSGLLNERLKVEFAFFRFASKAEKLRREKDEYARAIGERVFQERQQLSLLARDENLKGLLKEMEIVSEELDSMVEQASKIGREK
ncbi:MAG: hypothetical protein M0033_09065 [Nitrospiraceae bacterium]|nr:hypothetical protein [Nitrospiraceae bacterium]MDA8326357.1 hypothetical protein [Nitrospiraceae bacterium]